MLAVHPHLKVQVRAGGKAGRADLADLLPGLDRVALLDVDGTQVAVEGREPVLVLDHQIHAVPSPRRPVLGDHRDRSVRRRYHRLAVDLLAVVADVQAGVEVGIVIARTVGPADLVGAGDRPNHLHLSRGICADILLQLCCIGRNKPLDISARIAENGQADSIADAIVAEGIVILIVEDVDGLALVHPMPGACLIRNAKGAVIIQAVVRQGQVAQLHAAALSGNAGRCKFRVHLLLLLGAVGKFLL